METIVEIKRSTVPEVSRGFHSARSVLKPKEAYVVHGGTGTWPLGDGIRAVALPELMDRLLVGNTRGS